MAKMPMPGDDPYDYPGHTGVDFLRGPRNHGKPIRASAPGVVLRTPHNARGGYWTTIQYDKGALIGYAHQDRQPPVKAGERVKLGDIIGYVGANGTNVTGPHVHVENLNNPTAAGIWAVFKRSEVVTEVVPPEEVIDIQEESDMIINIAGKKGKRRGGLYYVSGGKATFIGPRTKGSAYPKFTNEKEIVKLQKVITGLK